ncbi:MAG TPA: hypothetical protein VIM13_03360, partial [Clostridia bacterium]
MSKTTRIVSLVIIDAVLLNLSIFFALLIKFDASVPQQYIEYLRSFAIVGTVLQLAVFWLFGLYRSLWEYASIEEMLQIIFATLVAYAIRAVVGYAGGKVFPVSVYIVGWILLNMMVGGTRISYRLARRVKNDLLRRRCKPSRAMI